MFSYKWCICTFVALLSTISSITATSIIVDPSGKEGFKTIQAAIDSVPSNNQIWTTIDIKQGVYREQVSIPRDKQFVYLKGTGQENTIIVWNDSRSIQTPTFYSGADNTLAKDITFINSYNYPLSSNTNPVVAAVAAWIQGDKSGFYHCRFSGVQDTLWDDNGRHYFRDCTIEGSVDFIFGAGQSHYESCTMSVDAEQGGFIAAQARGEPSSTTGFVFKGGNITGKGYVFLGRPWRDYARTLYYRTGMSEVVIPKGWDPWYSAGKEDLLTLSEYGCSGPGSNRSERVVWETKLSIKDVEQLISNSFIDKEGWVNKALQIWGA